MSSTYYSSKRQFETYGAYRAKMVLDVDKYNTYVKVSWHIYAQMQYKWGVGVGIKMSGADSGSDTGCLSSSQGGSSEWKTAASRSGSATFNRGTSSQSKTFKATAYGTAISGHSAADHGSTSVSHTVTIPALEDYTIRYSANGGSGAPSSQTKYYGRTLTLSSKKPTRTGYDFVGWGLSSGDTKKNYDPGDKYTANKSDTLYAIWKKKTYTVKYNANGGHNSGDTNQTKTYGVTLSLFRGTYFSRTGYKIIGWGTSASGGVVYKLGGSYTKNEGDTLYAVWEPLKYYITYNVNGGKFASNASLTGTKTYGSNYKIRSDMPSREGYKFLYWTDSKGTRYNAGDTYKANQNITLTANWEVSVNWMMVGQFDTKTKKYVVSRMNLTIGTHTQALPNIPNLYEFIGWSKTQLAVQPYDINLSKFSKTITVPAGNVSTQQRYIYGVYRDISPSTIRITYVNVIRAEDGALESDFNNYISTLEKNETFEGVTTPTDTLYGYIELSDIARNILSTNIKIGADSPVRVDKIGNRLYLRWVKSSGKYEANQSYKVLITLTDNKHKPITYTASVNKITQIFDITKAGSIYPIILGHDVQIHGTFTDGKTSDNLLRVNENNDFIFGNYNTDAYVVSGTNKSIYLGTSSKKPASIVAYGNLNATQNLNVGGTATITGNTTINGKLTVKNQIYVGSSTQYIGYVNYNTSTGRTIGDTGNWVNTGVGFTAPANSTYIITASIYYPAQGTSTSIAEFSKRGAAIGYASGSSASSSISSTIAASRMIITRVGRNTSVRVETTGIVSPSTSKYVRVLGYQTCDKTISDAEVSWRYVRIR